MVPEDPRAIYFRDTLKLMKEQGETPEVTLFAAGLVTGVVGAKIERLDEHGVTLFGMTSVMVGNQGVRTQGRLFAPYVDIIRVYVPSSIQAADISKS